MVKTQPFHFPKNIKFFLLAKIAVRLQSLMNRIRAGSSEPYLANAADNLQPYGSSFQLGSFGFLVLLRIAFLSLHLLLSPHHLIRCDVNWSGRD